MAKQVKSIRLAESLTDVFSDYSSLLQEMFGYSTSLSSIANEAIAEYLMDSASKWVNAMKSKSVVDIQPNGKMKHYDFSDEQIEKMELVCNNATGIWASLNE